MSKLFTDPGAINGKIAEYSNANPEAFINTFPKYLAMGIVLAVLTGGVMIFGAAVLAAL